MTIWSGRGCRALAAGACMAVAAALVASPASLAAPVKVHAVEGAATWLGGTFEGVRLDANAALELGARFERVAAVSEPFAFSVAALPDGWAVGTGNDGKVLGIGRDGLVRELFDAEEPEVFALWADPDGTLFAGTSPNGKVYRIREGRSEVYFDPGATYIWSIVRGTEGDLWVATGTEGKLFRVAASGRGTLAYDSTEPHLRALLPLPSGKLAIGTVGEGRVLTRDPAGVVRTLYDSPLAETVALAAGPAGAIYVAVLASEASFVELEPKSKEAPADADSEGGEAGTTGTRAASATGPRSELVRLLADGIVQPLWSSQEETLFAIATTGGPGGRLWLATGAEGRLHSLVDDSVRFESDFEERQIVGLLPGVDGPALLTTNAGALYRTAALPRAEGSYTGAVIDAGAPARYGLFRWRGARPQGAQVKVAFRSGASSVPDSTWSEWSAPVDLPSASGPSGGEGGELAIPAMTPARHLQYRIDLAASAGATPRIGRVEIAYRQVNQRPRIERFGAMEPAQILVPSSFNPADQIYEPATPNREGIFTNLEPVTGDGRTKTLWKRGMRTLRWRATDPNGDELRYAIDMRPERGGPRGEGAWFELTRDRKEDYYAFDAMALPDGAYRFRLRANDSAGNDAAGVLADEEISDVVIVDHSPPRRRSIERRSGGDRLTIADDWNPLLTAEISVDAGEWRDLSPVDGMVDGRSETFDLADLPDGARMVLLRVTDAAWNVTTFDLGAEVEP